MLININRIEYNSTKIAALIKQLIDDNGKTISKQFMINVIANNQ